MKLGKSAVGGGVRGISRGGGETRRSSGVAGETNSGDLPVISVSASRASATVISCGCGCILGLEGSSSISIGSVLAC